MTGARNRARSQSASTLWLILTSAIVAAAYVLFLVSLY